MIAGEIISATPDTLARKDGDLAEVGAIDLIGPSHLHFLTDKRSAQKPQIYYAPYLVAVMQNSGACLHAMPGIIDEMFPALNPPIGSISPL